MQTVKVWDPVVRLFHWSLVILFTLNAAFLEEDGTLHEWVGYGVLALVAVRILWGIVGTRHARFSAFPPDPLAAVGHLRDLVAGRHRRHMSHNPLGALMIYNLILTMLAIGVSGYMMTTITFFGYEWVEELHEMFVNWAILSVFLHIGGVIFESLRGRENLVKAMITGRKRAQPGGSAE